MLVFWKQKLVVLAVPKTGTSALAKALGPVADISIQNPPELKHAPLYRYNRFFRPMFEKVCGEDGLEIMALMREPVSWLSSWHRYRQRDALNGSPASTKEIGFDDFVFEYCKDDKRPFANVGSQAKFLQERPNGTKVNHLYAYEDFGSAINFLEERLELDISLEEVNRSKTGATALSGAAEETLRDTYASDFALYESLGAIARP